MTPPSAPVPTDVQSALDGHETPLSDDTPIGTATVVQLDPLSLVEKKVATSDVPFSPDATQIPTAGQSIP